MKKAVILIFLNRYLPGYRAGGPIQTVANMMAALGDRYDFHIVTTDRDFGDTDPYPGTRHGEWMTVGKARVRYLAPAEIRWRTFRKILAERRYDLLYCQSFFDPRFTLLPLLVAALCGYSRIPVLLAPRGEFGAGALAHKRLKKKIFLFVFRRILLKLLNYRFHCSSPDEENDLKMVLGPCIKSYCALDFSAQDHIDAETVSELCSDKTPLRIAFLGRIDVQKNIDYALGVLAKLNIPAIMDIYGNVCDDRYYQRCRALAKALPEHIVASFKGALAHDKVLATLSGYDLFFFPSKNENFGHVIHEALRAGLPALISNRTPWHELGKRNAGWELPLDSADGFAAAIESYSRLSAAERRTMRLSALQYGIDVSRDQRVYDDNVKMFDDILQPRPESKKEGGG